jgi:hypothetical protein
MSIEITEGVARKVLSVIDAGLVSGMGEPIPGKMCVEAAVCYALYLPHSDDPKCVAQSLRRLKIKLNDSRWSSNDARTKGLRRLGIAQLGSAGTLDEAKFASKISVLVIQKYLPITLRAAAASAPPEHKAVLEEAARLCSLDPSIANARKAKSDAADDAAYAAVYAAYAAAAYAADAAAYAADAAADDAADAADDAAYAAAYAAVYAAYAADADAKRDSVLAEFGEDVVQILIEMKATGTAFLYLTEGN